MRVLAWLACLLLAADAMATGAAPRRSWAWEGQHSAAGDPFQGVAAFKGRWHFSTLLGEPVVNCTASLVGEPRLLVRTSEAASADWVAADPGEVEFYNLMLVGMIDAPGAPTWQGRSSLKWAVFCDAGIVAQYGRRGFNVAGSPNWDRLFCETHNVGTGLGTPYDAREAGKDACAERGGQWVPAARAREAVRNGVDFRDFSVLNVAANASPVIRRVEKEDWRRRSADFKRERAGELRDRVSDGSIDGVYRGIDIQRSLPPLPRPPATPSAEQLAAYERALQALEEKYGDPAHRSRWREREKALLAAQLERLAGVEPRVQRADAALARYREALERAATTAPEAADPLADAMEMDIETFQENGLYGVRDPDGTVLTPPTYARTCGRHKGLLCVRDAEGRSSVVDAFGTVLLADRSESIRIDGRGLACASAIWLERAAPDGRSYQFALYSLASQSQTSEWITGTGISDGGDDCGQGALVEVHDKVLSQDCGSFLNERERVRVGYDGRILERGLREQYRTPNICLRSSPAR